MVLHVICASDCNIFLMCEIVCSYKVEREYYWLTPSALRQGATIFTHYSTLCCHILIPAHLLFSSIIVLPSCCAIVLCFIMCPVLSSFFTSVHTSQVTLSHLLIFLQPRCVLYREHTTFWHWLPRQPWHNSFHH